jgi:RNA polymerase sigma-70 factor (ECF subfamily)
MLLLLNFSSAVAEAPNEPNLDAVYLDNLLAKIAQGDQDALAHLYQATNKTVYAYILSLIGNFADAQDLLQDTYLKIRSGAHMYQSQGKPLAWIFTIAKNLTFMKLRYAKSRPTLALSEDEGLSIEAPTSQVEDTMVLREALLILSDTDRQIVFLHAISGMKHREIAEILQMPLATVLSKYARSLIKLNKHLRQQGIPL